MINVKKEEVKKFSKFFIISILSILLIYVLSQFVNSEAKGNYYGENWTDPIPNNIVSITREIHFYR